MGILYLQIQGHTTREYAQPAKAALLKRVLVNSQSLVHEINSVNYSY